MYNPEFATPNQESILPQELIASCKKGIHDIQSAQEHFDAVLDALDKVGVNDTDRIAYMKIMLAQKELSEHKKALEHYII